MSEEEARAALCRFVVGHDGNDFVIGRPDLGVYVAVPEPGAVFVEAVRNGSALAEATAKASDVAGQPVDADDFLDGLAAAGLLEPPHLPGAGRARSRRRIRWIEGVSQVSARRLFGVGAWTVYGLAWVFVVAVLALRPDLRPAYEHGWWLPDPVISVLVLFPVSVALTACHEGWHWLAGRAAGIPAVFRVSYRGAFLVFETDLTQIVATPRNRRYGPFLAGIAIDGLVIACALAVRLANRDGWLAVPGVVDRLLAAVVLVQCLAVAWQFAAVFMRSDMYAVLANALRCHDLYRTTWLLLKDRLWRLSAGEAAELAATGERDRAVARWFSLLYLAGMIGVVWLVLNFGLPFMIGMVTWAAANLAGFQLTSWVFWSSLLMAMFVVVPRVAPAFLAVREHRRRKEGALR
ncbi:hypothetical protein [Nonomuraea sp. NPDC003754]